MKRILAIDTSSKIASVALLEYDEKALQLSDLENVLEINKSDVKTHSRALMPIIDECLETKKIDLNKIDEFAIATGPRVIYRYKNWACNFKRIYVFK